ncbi:MAG: tetratricopeptide repeat protein [Limnochordia bacterium]|nr:tetratricopeptide repeat protein [Limnochordia bacterium]
MSSSEHGEDRFIEFVVRNPDLRLEMEQLNEEGQRLLREYDLEGAYAKFQRILEICPFSPVGHNNVGACYYYQGDYEKAAAHFRKTVQDYPDYVFALAMLARCQQELGDVKGAQGTMRRAVRAYRPGNPQRGDEVDTVEVICESFAHLEDDRGLFDFFRRYGGNRGISWPVVARAGVAAFNLGRFAQARRYWQQALDRQPTTGILQSFMFTAELAELRKVPEFRLDYELQIPEELKDIKDDGQLEDPKLLTGTLKTVLVEGLWTEDEVMTNAAIEVLTRSKEPWAEDVLWMLFDDPQLSLDTKMAACVALVRKGVVSPGDRIRMNVDGLVQDVVIRDRLAEYEGDPKVIAAFKRGKQLQEKGDLEQAGWHYRKAIEQDPNFVLPRLRLAEVYMGQERWKEANEVLSGTMVSDIEESDLWRYWWLVGETVFHLGQYDKAQMAFDKVRGAIPDGLEEEIQEWLEAIEAEMKKG